MKSRIYLLLLLAGYMASAQNPLKYHTFDEVVPPSPAVGEMLSFNDIPVDYYTGLPDIQVPVYSKEIMGLKYDLALRYNPAGVRVNVEAGAVGTGWSLNAGGVVSRSMVGIPDEMNMNIRKGVHNSEYYTYSGLSDNAKKEYLWNLMHAQDRIYDSGPDVYNFSILNRSGSFILRKGAQGALEPVFTDNPSKLKIQVTANTDSDISSFIITDEQGFKYHFGANTEFTHYTSFFMNTGWDGFPTYLNWLSFNNFPLYYTSAWMLEKIVSHNGQLICSFEYDEQDKNLKTLTNTTEVRPPSGITNPANYKGLPPRIAQTKVNFSLNENILKKVTFRDGSIINFTRGVIGSLDNNMLKKIEVKSSSSATSENTITVGFDYFQNNTAYKRPFLSSVYKYRGINTSPNNSNSEKYDFIYTNPSELEGFESAKRDIWGYYNGGGTFGTKTNRDKIKCGVLERIKLPTGGYKVYEFEANTYSYKGNVPLTITELYENPYNVTTSYVSHNYNVDVYNNNNSNHNDATVFYIYFDQDITAVGSAEGLPEAVLGTVANIYPVKLPSGNEPVPGNPMFSTSPSSYITDISRTGTSVQVNQAPQTLHLKKGFYYVDMYVPNLFSTDSITNVYGIIAISIKNPVHPQPYKYLYGGGVRIKSTSFKDGPNENILKTNYNYNTLVDNQLVSSGSYDGEQTLVREYTMSRVVVSPGAVSQCNYTVISHQNELAAQMTKGNYVGYKNVAVTRTDNGRTEYLYSSPIDVPVTPLNYSYPFPPIINQDYKRGNLLESKVFGNNNNLLNKTQYEYNFFEVDNPPTMFVGEMAGSNCPYNHMYYNYDEYINLQPHVETGIAENCGDAAPFNFLETVTRNFHKTGVAQLQKKTTTEYFYDPAQANTVTEETYTYNPDNLQINTVVTQFNEGGTVNTIQKNHNYPANPNSNATLLPNETAAYAQLVAQNRINEQVYYSESRNGELLGSKATTYVQTVPGQVMPYRLITAKNAGGSQMPVVNYTITKYDAFNNPLEVQQESGITSIYIWGYNSTVPIAMIQNCSYAEAEPHISTAQTASNGGNENQLITDLLAMRNAIATAKPEAMVTTYTYTPLKQISTITDPKGYTTTYFYDSQGRLQYAKDADNNILTENQYNYRP